MVAIDRKFIDYCNSTTQVAVVVVVENNLNRSAIWFKFEKKNFFDFEFTITPVDCQCLLDNEHFRTNTHIWCLLFEVRTNPS